MAGVSDMIAPIPEDTEILQKGAAWAITTMRDNAVHKANYSMAESMRNTCTCAAAVKCAPLVYSTYVKAPDIKAYVKANLNKIDEFSDDTVALLYMYAMTFRYHGSVDGTGKPWSSNPKFFGNYDVDGTLLRRMQSLFNSIDNKPTPKKSATSKVKEAAKKVVNSEAAKSIKQTAAATAKAAATQTAENFINNGTGGMGVKDFVKTSARQAAMDVKEQVKSETIYQAQRVMGVTDPNILPAESIQEEPAVPAIEHTSGTDVVREESPTTPPIPVSESVATELPEPKEPEPIESPKPELVAEQGFELAYKKAKMRDAELKEKDPDRYMSIEVPEPPVGRCKDHAHVDYWKICYRVKKYKMLTGELKPVSVIAADNLEEKNQAAVPAPAEDKAPIQEQVETKPAEDKAPTPAAKSDSIEQVVMLRNYPDSQVELKVFQEVMQKYNVPIPVHELCNRATRQWDELDLDKWERPIYYVACNVNSKWMRDTIREIDSIYDTSQHVKNYIAKYFHDYANARTPEEIKEEWDSTVRALPQSIQSYNACSNFKLCCYITSQLSKNGNENVDISDALFGNDAYAVDYLDKLDELVQNGEPVEVAKSEASDHANAMHRDYVEQTFEEERAKSSKSSGFIEKATKVAMAPANFKYDMNLRIRDAIKNSSPNGEAILQKMDEKRETRAREKEEQKAHATELRQQGNTPWQGNSYPQPGMFGKNKGVMQPAKTKDTVHVVAMCVPVVVAFVCVLLMIATSFSFKWACYIMSIGVSVFAVFQEAKRNKASMLFTLIGVIIMALSILF